MIETQLTCPLGSICKEIKDNKLHRCMWLIDIKGQNPQTGKEEDKEECAVAFAPVAMLEVARWTRNVQSATEDNRNQGSMLNKILLGAMEENNGKAKSIT